MGDAVVPHGRVESPGTFRERPCSSSSLTGFILLAVQEPDRSTPGKVFEGYMAAWQQQRVEEEKWGQELWDIHKRSAYCRGEKLQAKVAKDHAHDQQYWKDNATLSTRTAL